MSKLVALLSTYNTEIMVFLTVLSLVLITRKLGVTKTLFSLFHFALVGFVVMALFITFRRADHMPDPDMAFLKTLGFWGICVLTMFAFWIFLGLTKIKGQGPVILINLIGSVVCWIIYGLMF